MEKNTWWFTPSQPWRLNQSDQLLNRWEWLIGECYIYISNDDSKRWTDRTKYLMSTTKVTPQRPARSWMGGSGLVNVISNDDRKRQRESKKYLMFYPISTMKGHIGAKQNVLLYATTSTFFVDSMFMTHSMVEDRRSLRKTNLNESGIRQKLGRQNPG